MAPNSVRQYLKGHALTIVGAILRFALIFLLSTYSAAAQSHWRTISAHALLQQGGPYDPAIAAGEKLAQTWATFAFWWIVIGWVPAVLTPAPPSVLVAAIDVCAAVSLSVTTRAQTRYFPHKVGDCKGFGASQFQRPPGANESFFEASARLNATKTEPFLMCRSYLAEWQFGISTSVIFFTLALVKVTGAFLGTRAICREARAQNHPVSEAILSSSVRAFKAFPTLVVIGLLYIPLALLFRCLPVSAKAPVRFARRCGIKTGQGIAQKSAMKMEAVKKTIKKPREQLHVELGNGQPATLADFFECLRYTGPYLRGPSLYRCYKS